MSIHTTWIMEQGKATQEEALQIQNVISTEWLISRWSEATNKEIRNAISEARFFIANGMTWEVA